MDTNTLLSILRIDYLYLATKSIGRVIKIKEVGIY
jgi:hypothetical protein